MHLPPELPILTEDWEKTRATVQAVIALLWEENQALKVQMVQLQNQVEKLQSEVAKLRERVNKNSQNSSKPPSSDPPQTPRYPQPEPSGEKKGGRKGHHGHGRKLKGTEEVSRIVKSLPTVCKDCGVLLLGEDPEPERHQVSELPKIVPEIVEYQRHRLQCSVCGAHNLAEWPKEMPRGSFGERLQGLIGYLGGRFGISQRDMEEMLQTVFQVEIGLGSIPAQEQRLSQALKQPVEAAQQYVQTQPTVNLDETGWHELMKNIWLWVCTTPSATVFRRFTLDDPRQAENILRQAIQQPGPALVQAVVDQNEPLLPGNVSSEEAEHFLKAMLKGDKYRWNIIKTVAEEAVREVI
jgi:transposase